MLMRRSVDLSHIVEEYIAELYMDKNHQLFDRCKGNTVFILITNEIHYCQRCTKVR